MIHTVIEKTEKGVLAYENNSFYMVPGIGHKKITNIDIVKRFGMYYVAITGEGFEYLKPLTDKIEFINTKAVPI